MWGMDVGSQGPRAEGEEKGARVGLEGCGRPPGREEHSPRIPQELLLPVGVKAKDFGRPAITTWQMDALRQTGI